MNPPSSPLAHFGCAACVLLAACSGTLAIHQPELQLWLQLHWYSALLGFLAFLALAYLLEHALTTSAMLALLAAAAICAGFTLAASPLVGTGMIWQLCAGPLGYFATAALVLRCWPDQLYRWQLGCAFAAGGLAAAGIICGLTTAHPITTLCALLSTGAIAAFELIVFFGREYHEITSASRARSTVVAMVLLQAMPVCRIIWLLLRGSYYGIGGVLRFAYQWFRWG